MARTAGDRHGWLAIGGLFALATAQGVLGCTDPSTGGDGIDSEAIAALLSQVGPGAVVPALSEFSATANELQNSTAALAALSYGDDGWEEARDAAQEDWFATMDAWQRLEVMQVGPAAPSLTSEAGEDLRDEVYSWPSVNPCRVDQETVAAEWDNDDFFETHLVNVYGLDALETLLFAEGTDNDCPSQVDINSDGSWDALGAGVWDNRTAYAAALAADLVVVGDELTAAWTEEGHAEVLAAGEAPYGSQQSALNAVFDALFYLETRTKDSKVAPPLGLGDCTEDSCIDDLESPLAGQSQRWVIANLEGFGNLYRGGDGDGFDDLLEELGHGDLDRELQDRLAATTAAAEALQTALQDARSDAPDELDALHTELDALCDVVKGDLATVLTLTVPAEAAGDND